MSRHRSRTRSFVRLGAMLVAGTVVAGLAITLLWGQPGAPASPPAAPANDASVAPSEPPAPTRTVSAATPVHLRIPAIGVATRVTRLGLNRDQTVEVPAHPQRAGWYEKGPPPGQLGSSVILGHVDSKTGPAVFYRLASLRRGDRIKVSLSDDTTARFTVTSIDTYPNDAFPARQVYAGNPTEPSLNLVTCGGDYDAERGGYQSNVVVHAEHDSTDDPTT